MPADFLGRHEAMVRSDSLVFRGIDYFGIFLLLMTKRYQKLASHYVQLDPSRSKSEEEVVALIRQRLRRLTPVELARVVEGGRR
jgi:hypothetical protein